MRSQTIIWLVLLCFPTASVHADIVVSFGSGPNQFNMTFVPIGNPGNVADSADNPSPAGSVAYKYNIGKYEVSRDMVNKANAEGNLGITMGSLSAFGGNGPNRPASGSSWNEAARFVNWLNTSQGFHPAYKFNLQPGQTGYDSNQNILLWQSSDLGFDPSNRFRNSLARYFIPSFNEWHKAAYYDPSMNDGTGGYWNFPTGSDMVPISVNSGTNAGTAVWSRPDSQGPADIDNAGGLSPYGVMGMGGNVWEFQETSIFLTNTNPNTQRVFRGGNWAGDQNSSVFMSASHWASIDTRGRFISTGFRIVSIPEPSSAVFLILSNLGLLVRRTRSN